MQATTDGNDPNFMLSLARGLTVLEALSEPGGPWTVAALVRATGLARGAVVRCLHTLQMQGYAERQGATYALSARVLRLANGFAGRGSLPALAQPALEQLATQTGCSCSLGMRDGDEVVYVGRVARERLMALDLAVGSRLPLWCTSMGRVLLAALPPVQREMLVPSDPLPATTARALPTRAAVLACVAQVAQEGMALVDQELEPGLISMAVPVRDGTGAVVAALNLGANALSITAQQMTALRPLMIDAAADIAHRIAYAGR